ncbi:MAG: hypothetical protein ACPG77_19650, partial [Nannocystaceae bacterium]
QVHVEPMRPVSAAKGTNVHPPRKLAYMEQGCEMTLREGLDEYYTQIEGLITEDNADSEVAALFHHHDICHVLFGCDTSLPGETLADTWAMSGTDVTLSQYMQYFKLQETKDILGELATWNAFKTFLSSFHLMPRAWWRARKMTKKWPFMENDAYLDTPLRELRESFNIEVLQVN